MDVLKIHKRVMMLYLANEQKLHFISYKMKIHLIRGFTRHGKSTFAQKLSDELTAQLNLSDRVKIYSFATPLKQEVCDILGIKDVIDKDQDLPLHLQKDGCVTFRDWCKHIALQRKQEDPQYFAKLVLAQILQDHSNLNETEVIIDDFRFPEELMCLSSFCFNDEVSRNAEIQPNNVEIQHYLIHHVQGIIPDKNNISEHSLDHLQFDNEILVLR